MKASLPSLTASMRFDQIEVAARALDDERVGV
jgi:hypothetical protein